MGKTNTAHLEFCTYQNTNQAPTKVNMYCSNSQCNDQIHVTRFTLMPLTEGIKAVKKLLAYRKEDVFLVLIDSSRVWNYVTVLDDRHRLSCKHVHRHVISTSRYSENTVHLHNHTLYWLHESNGIAWWIETTTDSRIGFVLGGVCWQPIGYMNGFQYVLIRCFMIIDVDMCHNQITLS